MSVYETVFIARQDLTEAQVKDLADKAAKIVKDQGGKVLKTEHWGLRTLAYKINKNRKGHYVLIESDAPGAAVIELERVLRLEEDIMRTLTVRLEKPSEGPSAVIDKSGRDDTRPPRFGDDSRSSGGRYGDDSRPSRYDNKKDAA